MGHKLSKKDLEKIKDLIKKGDKKVLGILAEHGIAINKLEEGYELSDEAQRAITNAIYEDITQGGIIITQPSVECPEGQHWDSQQGKCVDDTTEPEPCPPGQHRDPTTGQCVPDVIVEPPGGGTGTELKDKFGIPYFHKSKANGFNYEMSDDPKNDQAMDELDDHYTVSGGVITMRPDGPTSLGVGRHVREEKEPEGGCNMDFAKMEKQMWTCFEDDVRDLEYKAVIRIKGLDAGNGFSMSCCTNRHTSSDCCQGFAYMFNIEDPQASPVTFRFRKEMLHVSYHNSPEGVWTSPDIPMALDGAGWFGYGFCRYNSPDNQKVILEAWISPPGKDYTKRENWVLLKRIEDFNGRGWGDDGDKCNGAKDQYGPWSGRQNRLKTNSTKGTVEFKCITFREIDADLF